MARCRTARYRDEAVERVAQSKAGEQQFIAPVRVLPYTEDVQVTEPDEQGNQRKVWRKREGTLLQTPRRLKLSGEMVPSVREVGLYRVQVYSWKATLHAEYDSFDYAAAPTRAYGQPYLAIGMSDVRGLVGTPRLQVDGRTLALESGAGALADRSAGIHAQLGPLADPVAGRLQDGNVVDMQFVLDGTRRLAIAPIADNNEIALRSAWQHRPSAAASCRMRRASDRRASMRVGRCRRWPPVRRRSCSPAMRRWIRWKCAWSTRWTCIPRPTAPASTASCSWC